MPYVQRKQPNYVARIHIAQKNLGMTDDDARAIKLQIVGKESCKLMLDSELRKIYMYLSQLASKQQTGVRMDFKDPRWRKSRALWHELHSAKKVDKDTDRAMRKWVEAQIGVAEWKWLNDCQVNTVIESLKAWLNR